MSERETKVRTRFIFTRVNPNHLFIHHLQRGFMKNLLKFSMLLLAAMLISLSQSYSQSGWVGQTSGTTNLLFGVSFPDANTGTAVGRSGTILHTTNGGAIWVGQTSGTTRALRSVSFTDANTGTAVGDTGTILRTTNGGATWVPQSSGTMVLLTGVSFTDVNTGTAVGQGAPSLATILRTTNGGATWVP